MQREEEPLVARWQFQVPVHWDHCVFQWKAQRNAFLPLELRTLDQHSIRSWGQEALPLGVIGVPLSFPDFDSRICESWLWEEHPIYRMLI